MADASLIWTSRTWPQTGSSPPFLTAPPEQPGWSAEAGGATATPIPAKGFLAAVFDPAPGAGSAAARSALEQAWREVDEARVRVDLAGTVGLLARAVAASQDGGAKSSAILVLVHGDSMAWSSSGGCRLFFCRAGSAFEELTEDEGSSQGLRRLSSGDLLILGNTELARRTSIAGQAGDIENITEDNADGWLESLSGHDDHGSAITFCMIGVRALPATTIATPADVARTATIYPAAPAPAGNTRGFPRGGIIAIALLVALLGLGAIYLFQRGATSTTPAAGSPTAEPDTVLPAEAEGTEAPTASPTAAAVGSIATTLVPEETAVPTATPAPATAAPVETPTTAAAATGPASAAAPVATSPAVIFGAFVYPRLLDDTGYNNSVEFLTTLFGPPTAEDPAYVAYIRDYVTANPDALCPSGAVIWFCLGGREIPDLAPGPAWVAFTGEIATTGEAGLVLRSGAQTYVITDVEDLDTVGSLSVGNRLSVVGRIEDLTWDPAAPTGVRVDRTGAAIPVTAAFARLVSSDGAPGEWRRAAALSSEAERPIWLYSSDRELVSELVELPSEAAEALAQGNVLIQGTLDQAAEASPQIEARAVYALDLSRNRYLCRYGELPDATCP